MGPSQNISTDIDVDRLSLLWGAYVEFAKVSRWSGPSCRRYPELPCALRVGEDLSDRFPVTGCRAVRVARDMPEDVVDVGPCHLRDPRRPPTASRFLLLNIFTWRNLIRN